MCVFVFSSGGRSGENQGGAAETSHGQKPGDRHRQRGNSGDLSDDVATENAIFCFFFVL